MSNTYQIYLISDSTGETLDRIFLALQSQFTNFNYDKKEFVFIRTEQQIAKILKECKKQRVLIGKKSKISFIKDRPGHDFRYAIDCSKIERELKWRVATNINDGLSQTIKWYYQNQRFFKMTSSKIFNKRLGLKL